MRSFVFFFLGLVSFGSCKDHTTQPIGPYDFMMFERQGGGNLEFTVTPLKNADSLEIVVVRREFRDTTIHMVLPRDVLNHSILDALENGLSGKYPVAGDFTQSRLPTGTWVRIYMVNDKGKEEVTNVELRNNLLGFEPLVRERL